MHKVIINLFSFPIGKFAAVLTLFLSCGHSFAASLDEIVVTAKGDQSLREVLQTAHVLDLQDIESSQATDITDLIDYLPGVSVNDTGGRGSVTSFFVRGTSSSQNIVLIDGVRVGSATLGSASLNSYPIEAIERVEVVKGPLAGIYGADAVGGVIQLFTRKGQEGRGTATATIGSDSLVEYGLALNVGNDEHSFRISAHVEELDGFDRTSILTGGNADEDGFEQTAVSLAGKTTLSDSTTAQLSILYSDNSADFDNTFGEDIGNVNDSETLSAALNITTELSDTLRWSNTLGLNSDEVDTTSSFPSTFETDRDSFGSELQFTASKNTTLVAGINYYEESISSTTMFPVDERDNKSAYVQLQSSLNKFDLIGTLRYDDNLCLRQ